MASTPFVFIYGPPAVGKLTVARELAKLTGLRLFHNHLSIDAIVPVFDWWSPPFNEALDAIRFGVIEAAMRHRIGLIFTFVYARPQDDPFVADLRARVAAAGARFVAIKLECDRTTLMQRVVMPSRQNTEKARTEKSLANILDQHDCVSAISGVESLVVDTGNFAPTQTAKQIADHLVQ